MINQQMDLLSKTPIARNSDPETSHESAEVVTKTSRAGQQLRCRDLVCLYPGHTSAELAKLGREDRYMVARRLPEVRPVHVRNGEARKCTVTGRKAMTWYMTT